MRSVPNDPRSVNDPPPATGAGRRGPELPGVRMTETQRRMMARLLASSGPVPRDTLAEVSGLAVESVAVLLSRLRAAAREAGYEAPLLETLVGLGVRLTPAGRAALSAPHPADKLRET